MSANGQQRSKRLRAITCVSGMGAAAVGFVYVVTGNGRAIDVALIAAGLLIALAGLILIRGRPRD